MINLSIFTKFQSLDESLFLQINKNQNNRIFDYVMPLLREATFWVPLYLFMALLIVVNFGKRSIYWLLSAGITAGLSDFISSKIIKPYFARPRPCMDELFSSKVTLLASYCGGNGSFTSSHASNHFGLAFFFFITLQHIMPRGVYFFFLWATLVCYAQIYVGVHYPTDILGGMVLGTILGIITGKIHNNFNKLSLNIVAPLPQS